MCVAADEPLKIVADAFREGVFCQNLYEVEVKSPEQTLQLLEFAEQRSKQQETTANKMSSRAHRVFMVTTLTLG
jgi:Kinesin motor domain